MYFRGFKRRVVSLIIAMVMLAGLVSVVPLPDVKADSVTEVDITDFNGLRREFTATAGAKGTAYDAGMVQVKLQLPEEYNSFAKLNAAGLTSVEIVFSVQDYSDIETYDNPDTKKTNKPGDAGFQLFSYSKDRNGEAIWDNTGGWGDLRSYGTNQITKRYNFSRFFSNTLLYIGFQFALLDPSSDITYTIQSVKLVAEHNNWAGYDSTPVNDSVKCDVYDPDPNYAKLLQESLYFFDMNMCGSDVDDNTGVLWRGNCHTTDTTTYNEKKVDVTGGYHDAGDHVKFGLTLAYSASMLGMIYREYQEDFDELGQDEHIKLHLNRFADYFRRCTVMDDKGKVKAFCYQVGDDVKDHEYWGEPEKQDKPENQGDRKDYIKFTSPDNPCTDIVAETAAALALHSIIFDDSKSLTYAKALLDYAENKDNTMKCASTDGVYDGKSYVDDLALASYWLFVATKDFDYRTKYINYMSIKLNDDDEKSIWDELSEGNMCWDNVCAANMIALDYSTLDSLIESEIDKDRLSPVGYAYITDDSYGTARYNTTLQYLALTLDKHRRSSVYKNWATGQMNYLLGNNPAGKCYVIGYNDLSVKYPHHRAASGYIGGAQAKTMPAHLMLGTLVGGPLNDDSFDDDATKWMTNEVALDYQVGLVGAAVALYHAHKGNQNADKKKLHSLAYLRSVEIDKYYGKGDDDPSHPHNPKHTEAKDATCTKDGNVEYWYCDRCEQYFSDEDCTKELAEDSITVHAIDHAWNDPTYTWTEDEDSISCTAEKTCKNNTEDSCKVSETVTIAKADINIIEAADCETAGKGTYTASFENKDFETQTKEVVIPATGHDFGEVVYTWSDDNSTVTATRVCKNDPTHIETETVNASYEANNATGSEDGSGKYISDKFKNEIFKVQTKEIVTAAAGNPSGKTETVQQEVQVKQEVTVTQPQQKEEPVQKAEPVQKEETEQKGEDGTDVGPGASETLAEKAILNSDSDEGPAGSSFGVLQARMKKVGKDSITITWNKVSGAKYVIYGNQCGKNNKYEKIAEVTTNKFTQKKLKKGTYYKYIIVSVKDGKVVSTSKTLHIATQGGKICNHSKIKINKKSLKLKKGKTDTLKVKLVNEKKNLKTQNHRKVKFESSNTAVVTVTDKGKVKAVGQGTAYIYAYVQNGIMAKTKVTVK